MATVYTPICPLTLAYTNLNHILHIKHAFKPNRLVLCVWDLFALDDHRLQGSTDERRQRLAENTDFLVRMSRALGMDCKAIRLSEAWDRVFKKSSFCKLLQKITTRMTFADVQRTFEAYPRVATEDLSLSMMNYHIVDYIVAAHLPEVFPELASVRPRQYAVSERFRPFEKTCRQILHELGLLDPPEVSYTRGGPFVMDEHRFFPSLGMTPERIQGIFKHYVMERQGMASEAERSTYIDVLGLALGRFSCGAKQMSKSALLRKLTDAAPMERASILAKNTCSYFSKIGGLVRNEHAKENARHLFITGAEDFHRQIRPLNWMKLSILRHCDGTSTCSEIARKLGLNPNTVAVYFSRLRSRGLVTGERRPRRTVQSIVIDLENLDAMPMANRSPPDEAGQVAHG